MKKIAIVHKEYTPVIDALKHTFFNCTVDCFKEEEVNTAEYDLTIVLENADKFKGHAISCHHSLLPSFNSNEPVKDAILEGVKVTGITIYYTDTKKIIAQYPVFINNDTHYDNLKQELEYLEQTILPLVAKKVLDNEPFEIKNILNKSCKNSDNGCGGCSLCSH